jgi:bacteriorhodopsin
MDEVMVVTGLVGALVASSYKWGYFVFAMVALFFIFYNIVFVGRPRKSIYIFRNLAVLTFHPKDAHALNNHVGKVYTLTGAWTMFLWFIYPIAWGLCEGGNLISPDSVSPSFPPLYIDELTHCEGSGFLRRPRYSCKANLWSDAALGSP